MDADGSNEVNATNEQAVDRYMPLPPKLSYAESIAQHVLSWGKLQDRVANTRGGTFFLTHVTFIIREKSMSG